MKKIVYLRPKPTTLKVFDGVPVSNARIGSVYVGNTQVKLGMGDSVFNKLETEYLMPQVLGISYNSPDFMRALEAFWTNYGISVPPEGLMLDVGGVDENGNFNPFNINDYILYRFCWKHREVANSYALIEKSPKIRFYLISPGEEAQAEAVTIGLKDKASSLRINLFKKWESDKSEVEAVLYAMGVSPEGLSKAEIVVQLYALAENQPQRFIDIANNPQLKQIAFLNKATLAGIVKRPMNTELFMYNDITLGNGFSAAIAFLNDVSNRSIRAEIEARMEKQPPAIVDLVILDGTNSSNDATLPATRPSTK